MERKARIRSFFIPALILALAIGNYSRLPGNESVRPIQVASLIAIGMCLGILVRNLFALMRGRS